MAYILQFTVLVYFYDLMSWLNNIQRQNISSVSIRENMVSVSLFLPIHKHAHTFAFAILHTDVQ